MLASPLPLDNISLTTNLSYQGFQSVQSQQMQTAQSELILPSIDGAGMRLYIRTLTLCF